MKDSCYSVSNRQEVHGQGFLSSTGSSISAMTDLCGTQQTQPQRQVWDPMAARSQTWPQLNIMSVGSVREGKRKHWEGLMHVCGLRCSVCIWPPEGSHTRTWPVGSPRRLQMWGTILLSVRLWEPNLQKQKTHNFIFHSSLPQVPLKTANYQSL